MRAEALREAVLKTLRSIPPGRVATYGQLAALAGRPGAARAVGRLLRDLPPESRVPWHRVLSAPGRIAPTMLARPAGAEQRRRLHAEGVAVAASGHVDLSCHGWRPRLARLHRSPP